MTFLFKNLIFSIVRDPESENLLVGLNDGVQNKFLKNNLISMANFLDKIVDRENLIGGEVVRELNSFIM